MLHLSGAHIFSGFLLQGDERRTPISVYRRETIVSLSADGVLIRSQKNIISDDRISLNNLLQGIRDTITVLIERSIELSLGYEDCRGWRKDISKDVQKD